MNALEDRLHDVLRDAMLDERPRHDLAGIAMARAEQIRRRRTASRAALGVSALVGASAVAVAVELPDRAAVRTTPAASAAPAAQPAGEADVRVVRAPCEWGAPTSADPAADPSPRACTRFDVEMHWPDGSTTTNATELTTTPADRAWDAVLVIERYDGTTVRIVPRSADDGVWEYDVALPPRSEVRTFSFSRGS